ncbi:MAG TPA: hypothetical protein PLU80_00205 [Acidobacteriota bacterium]|nr:hypothetical protein [Acidobacteriota bacterium]
MPNKTLKILKESLPTRCEVCHQSDLFDPVQNYCARCQSTESKPSIPHQFLINADTRPQPGLQLPWIFKGCARFQQALLLLYLAWIMCCFFTFLASAVLRGGEPYWVPLPWSEMADFAGDSQGNVYVALRFYDTVRKYNRDGACVAAFPGVNKGSIRLEVDKQDRLYIRDLGRVFVFDQHGNALNGTQPEDITQFQTRLKRFKMNEFSRSTYFCGDGTRLERHWNSLTRVDSTGREVGHYHAPWYLWWATFPFPGLLAWISLAVVALRVELLDRATKSRSGETQILREPDHR